MEMEDSLDSNFNTVKEMILDEEKIVTYVSLSKDLCIHINDSKKILNYFVKKILENDPKTKLNVNYIISGVTENNKALTTVCTDDTMKNIKSTFKSILFEHIYSISKGSSSTDHSAILLLSKFDDFTLCSGLIKNNECSKRTSDEIGSLKVSSQQLTSERKEAVTSTKKIKEELEKSSKFIKNNQSENKKSIESINNKTEIKVKTEVVSPKKDASKNNIKSNNQKTQKGIAGFFNKSFITGANKKVLQEPKIETKQSKNIDIKEEKMDIDDHKHESNQIIEEKHTKKKNKVLNEIKKKSKVDKKRKRVLHVSDSDSNDENDPFLDKQEARNESDDEIPSTPTVTNIKITSGIVNPKKRRKVVDKTYTDEDGYILTKKEEVYESCSENEEEVSVKPIVKEIKQEKIEISPKDKKNIAKASKKKISPPQKGKQATLAQFFKKV